MKKSFKFMSLISLVTVYTQLNFASHDESKLHENSRNHSMDILAGKEPNLSEGSSSKKITGIIHAKERSKKEIDLQNKHKKEAEARSSARRLAQSIVDDYEMNSSNCDHA